MARLLLSLVLSLAMFSCGCSSATRWQIDLNKIEGFDTSQWDGKVRVVCRPGGLFEGYRIDYIEFRDHDGNVVLLEHENGSIRAFKEVKVERIPFEEPKTVNDGA